MNATKTTTKTQTIAGRTITLAVGQRYIATRPIARLGRKTYPITIRNITDGWSDDVVLKLPGMTWVLRSLNPDKKVQVGKPVPHFELTLLDGSHFSDKDLEGHWTLMDFWATWCSPCVGEMPNLDRAWKKYHPRGLQMLSLSLDRNEDDIATFRKEKWKMPWKHAFLQGGFKDTMTKEFEVSGIPSPILVAPDGTIAAMAPLLGLLGTVLGMIDIFSSFMGTGMSANAAVLAGGISKALITTAAGLMVGIPSVFFHRFLQRRVDELVVGMEQEAIKLVEVVQGDRDVDLVGDKA
jgi:thiol-disulfide isomerase/thioredoxin